MVVVNLNDMLVFVMVVEGGSFTAAAEKMGLPKSNISRKITRLETFLGTKLLQRSTRQQHLTEVGQLYFQHCKRIQEEVDHAHASVEQLLEQPQGRLKVCASITIGQQILRDQLALFLQTYPKVDLQLDLTNRRVDLLEEGFDIVIRVGDLQDSSLIAKYLGRTTRGLYASSAYLTSNGKPDGLEQLTSHNTLVMTGSDKASSWQLIDQQGTAQTIKLKPRLICDNFRILQQAAVDGLGIAALPHYMGKSCVANAELETVLPEWCLPGLPVYAVYPSHRGATPKVRVFLEYFAKVFEQALTD